MEINCEIKQSTIQFIGGPRDGSIVRLKKSQDTPKRWKAQAERLYPSLYQDLLYHVYELRSVPLDKKSKKIRCRYVHTGLVELEASGDE